MEAEAPSAYSLPPGIEPRSTRVVEVGGEAVRIPELEPKDIAAIAGDLIQSAVRKPAHSRESLVHVLGEVARSWLDSTSPDRREAERLLPSITGFAAGMVGEALDRLFHAVDQPAIETLLSAEADALRRGGPPLIVLFAAGTVFPPAIVGGTAALLLGSAVLIKPASAEPLLASLWARSIARFDAEIARRVAVLPWPRSRLDLTAPALAAAGAILVHGDDGSIASIRDAAPPGAHLIAHGHRVSAAILGSPALAADPASLARGLAGDVALYDQEGCLSPHTVFIEETDELDTRAFADLLAAELARLQRTWPRARLAPAAASSLRQFLLTAELEGRTILGGIDAGWAMVVGSRAGQDSRMNREPRFEFSPLCRTVILEPVRDVAEAMGALAAVRDRLQAVGIALPARVRLDLARRLGLYDDVRSNPDWAPRVRLCAVGGMQSPPIHWPADGQRVLGSLCPPRS